MSTGRRVLLVVDDQFDVLTATKRQVAVIARELEAQLLTAMGGQVALNLLTGLSLTPDDRVFVLSDCEMHGMDGIKLFTMLALDFPGMKIGGAIYTGNPNRKIVIEASGLTFIGKPAPLAELREPINAFFAPK